MAMPVTAVILPTEFPPGFEVKPSGVYSIRDEKNPQQLTTTPVWLITVLRTLAGKHWSAEIAWRDHDGQIKTAVIGFNDLSHLSAKLEELACDGLSTLPGATGHLASFLVLAAALPTTPKVRTHRKLGFFTVAKGGKSDALAFMLPYTCLQPAAPEPDAAMQDVASHGEGGTPAEDPPKTEEPIWFHPVIQSKAFEAYRASGTLEEWQNMLRPLAGNALVVFAVCVGLASPFLYLAGQDNVIFHLFGNSSTGKTTALQAGVSPWGRATDPQVSGLLRSLIERWNSTANAMEPMAATHSGLLLAIDELGSSGDAIVSIYNATGGRGKSRMTETGGMRDQHEWTLCILSSGEFSMQEKIEATTRRKAKTGEIIRANDIPVAELAHDAALTQEDERQLIDALKRRCGECYGTAGPAFVQAVLDTFQTESKLRAYLKESIDAILVEFVREAQADGRRLGPAHVRALTRFAFVATLGGLAVESGVLPFSEDVVLQAIATVSNAWLSALPPLSEGERAVECLRDYVIRHTGQILNFDGWRDAGFLESAIPRDMRAIQKGNFLLFTAEQFGQACGGLSTREALKHLHGQGMLKREGQKQTCRFDIAQLGLKRFPFYAVIASRLLGSGEASPASDAFESPVSDDGATAAGDDGVGVDPSPSGPVPRDPNKPRGPESDDDGNPRF